MGFKPRAISTGNTYHLVSYPTVAGYHRLIKVLSPGFTKSSHMSLIRTDLDTLSSGGETKPS